MALARPDDYPDRISERRVAETMGFSVAGLSAAFGIRRDVVAEALALAARTDPAKEIGTDHFVAGVNLALASFTVSDVVVDTTARTVTWAAPPWTMPTRYLVEFRNAPGDAWSSAGFTTATAFDAAARLGGQLIRHVRLTCVTSAGEAEMKILADLLTGSTGEVLPNQYAYRSAATKPALPTSTAEALPAGWSEAAPAASATMDVYRISRSVEYSQAAWSDGLDHPHSEFIYRAAAADPGTPPQANLPAGWDTEIPSVPEGRSLWASRIASAGPGGATWAAPYALARTRSFESASSWRFDPSSQPWRERIVAPDAPTALAASSTGASTATLVWMPPAAGAPVIGYEHRLRAAGGTWGAWSTSYSVHPGTGQLSTTLTGLAAATSYEFEVRATNGAGSGASATVTFDTAAAPTLSVPRSLAVSAIFDTGARVAWAAPSTGTPTGYQFRLRVANGTWGQWIGTTLLRTNLTGLLRGTSYEVEVRAVAGSVNGPAASASFATTGTAGLPPAAPRSLSARATDDATISLIWSAPTTGGALTGYEYRYRASGGAWPATWQSIQVFNVRVTGLAPATAYEFEVRSVGPNGRSVVVSATATTAAAVAPPGVPRSLGVSFFQGVPQATWLVPSSGGAVTDYEYRVREEDGTWPTTWTSTAGARSAALTGLDPATDYEVAVRARGRGGASSAVTAAFTTLALPGALITSVDVTGPARIASGRSGTFAATVGASSRYDTLAWSWGVTDRDGRGVSHGRSGRGGSVLISGLADGNYTAVATATGRGTGTNARDGSSNSRTGTFDFIVGTLPLSRPGPLTATVQFPNSPQRRVRVTFTDATGGSPPYTYKYRYASYTADGDTRTSNWSGFSTVPSPIFGADPTFSVTGLTRGTNYQIQVYVHDSTGDPGINNSNFRGVFVVA